MATRVKSRSDLHADDLYAWSRGQADLLRAGRFAELDLAHLIEEIEDVGGALKRAVRHRTRTILEHLLKLEHSRASEPRPGWRATIRTQRLKLRDRADADPAPRAGAGAARTLCRCARPRRRRLS